MRTLVVGMVALVAVRSVADETDCLRVARQAVAARRYGDAVSRFAVCAKEAPDDEVVLSEMAAAAQLARRPDADVLARRAVAAAKTPEVRAAALATLASTEHELPDRHAEMELLLASLRLRPNPDVAARLAKVGAGIVPSFAGTPMSGPFASFRALCRAAEAEAVRVASASLRHGGRMHCACDETKERPPLGPFAEARLLAVDCKGGEHDGEIPHLLVRTQDGWFFAHVVEVFPEDEPGCSLQRFDIKAPILAAGGRLVVRAGFTESCSGHKIGRGLSHRVVVVAGMGPSGKPTLVGPIVTTDHVELFDPAGRDELPTIVIADWDLDATMTEAGELELQGITKGWGSEAIGAVVGKHALSFP